jgi:hypothetical protein
MANCSPSCQRRFSSVSSGQRLFGSSWPTSKSCRRFLGFRCNAFEENPNWQLTYAATLPEAKRANAVSNIRSVRLDIIRTLFLKSYSAASKTLLMCFVRSGIFLYL